MTFSLNKAVLSLTHDDGRRSSPKSWVIFTKGVTVTEARVTGRAKSGRRAWCVSPTYPLTGRGSFVGVRDALTHDHEGPHGTSLLPARPQRG